MQRVLSEWGIIASAGCCLLVVVYGLCNWLTNSCDYELSFGRHLEVGCRDGRMIVASSLANVKLLDAFAQANTFKPPPEYNWHFDLLGVSIRYLSWNDASTDWLVRLPLLMLAAFFAVVAWLCLLYSIDPCKASSERMLRS